MCCRNCPFLVLVLSLVDFSNISTNRLLIRPLTVDDAGAMFLYRRDPDVARFQSWQPESVEQTREFIAHTASQVDTAGTWFQLGMERISSRELIGDCGLHFPMNAPAQVEVGITLAPQHQGQGFALELLTAVLEFLFANLGKHRVYASVDPSNLPAVALLKRAGMRQEAHFIESYLHRGAWVDDVVFALLRREWEVRHPSH